MKEPIIESVKKLDLKPSDYLILKSPERMSQETYEYIKKKLKEEFPNNKIMILEAGLEIEVVSPETMEEHKPED